MKLQPHQINLNKDLNFTGGNIHLAGGRLLVGDGTETTPSISFTNDTDTGIFLASAGEIAISAGANAFVFLKDDGTVEMTGTTGLAVQAGSTAERPANPLDGLLRYNLDTDNLETSVNSVWNSLVKDNDKRLSEYHVMMVSKEPGLGEFSTISDALAAVSSPSTTNRYMIEVGPGTFLEPTLVFPPYVSLNGDKLTTVISPNGANKHLFQVDVNCTISNIFVTGVSGANFAAFYTHSTNTTVTGSVSLNNIRFGANNTQILVQQDTGTYATVYVEGGLIGADGSFDQGFIATGPGSARINVRSLTTNGTTLPGPSTLFKADGPLTTVLAAGSLFRNSAGAGNGIHLRNGGTARFVGVSVLGFAKAIWCENNGSAPVFNGDGINLQSNVQDIVIEHPGTTGHFLGCAERSKVTVDSAAPITVFYSDPTNTGITSVGPVYLGPSHAKTTEMSDLFSRATTMGFLNGGALTAGSGFVVNISAGFGYCSISDPIMRAVKLSWNNSTLTLPTNTANFVYVTNAGVLSYSSAIPDLAQNIVLGRVVTNGSSISWIEEIPSQAAHLSNEIETMLRASFGPVYASGSVVTEGTTARTLNVTAGEYYYGSIKITPSGGSNLTLRQYYHSSSAWTYTDTNVISNTSYDNGTGLTSISAGNYVRHSLYVVGEGVNEKYILVYGQAQYSSLVLVEAAALPLPPPQVDESVTLIASIVVRQGQTNIVEIFDHRPVLGAQSAKLSAASDHGNLLGLDDDDHTQYLLVNGNRAMAGSLNLNTNQILNAGNINGVSITAHSSRHLPNGADPLTTSSAVGLNLSSTNTTGTANAFARADHTHAITGVQASSTQLTALAAFAGSGIIARTAADTFAARTLTGTTNTITITNGSGVAGNPTITVADNPVLPGTAGVIVPTGTTAQRVATNGTVRYNSDLARLEYYHNSAWGTLISNQEVAAGYQPLNAHLTSLAATSANGLIARTAAGTTTPRTLTGTASQITVTNGDGVSGNPTVALTPITTASSFVRVNTDVYGRVTGGTLGAATFYATRFDSPMTTGSWPIKAQAAAYLDPSHPSMTVRGFDDTTPEGVGISSDVPAGAVSCNITLVGRARTAPSAAQSALWNTYYHSYPIGVLAPDWGSAIALNSVAIASGNTFLYSVTTNVTLTSMGLTSGSPFQMEITRNASAAGDTLVGDFCLFYVRLDWQAT